MNPLVLIAELTHRCPLRCGYCSNPRALVRRDAELDTQAWISVLEQAAELGVVLVHFTGGEPLLREDLGELVRAAVRAGLYPTLITSGLGPGDHAACLARLGEAIDAGVRAVQVSFQDTIASAAAAVSGRDEFPRKRGFARHVRALGASLTTNFVVHRGNIERLPDFIALSLELGADRVELAHAQIHGWAELNRERLLPARAQLDTADAAVARARRDHGARIDLLYVLPDLLRGRPKPCMGGWGRRAIVVDPEGVALPCHNARSLPLEHDNVRDRSLAAIWSGASFSAFRGQAWMDEPCRSCSAREHDFGGCRCQAFAITGRITATDPACQLAPEHSKIIALRRAAEHGEPHRPIQLRTSAIAAGTIGDR
jgi:PqqA peptide cyclase